MATVEPFAALRPKPAFAGAVCELPYDVLSTEEARHIARDNPLSFLRVSKPEIDLPIGTNPYSPEVYARGRDALDRLRRESVLIQDPQPGYYVYRQIMGAHRQTGLVAVATCAEYRSGMIQRHELTRPDKEDDRVRHIECLGAQTGPAFLAYRSVPSLDARIEEVTCRPPAVDFQATDGIRHQGWTLFESEAVDVLRREFAQVPRLFIADGHHRTAAASRIDLSRGGSGHADRFLAVIFPHHQLQILPYHRVLRDLNGRTAAGLLDELRTVAEVDSVAFRWPSQRHDLGLYLEGRWHGLRIKSSRIPVDSALDQLDVSLLQRLVLKPIFGIDEPRTSRRIDFVGGIRGRSELERWVDAGEAACAFAMFPTFMDDLLAVADGGQIMPPKSTWFEPKLRDGMFSHLLE
jgi:uncharacterized protein (DUF1015 family)